MLNSEAWTRTEKARLALAEKDRGAVPKPAHVAWPASAILADFGWVRQARGGWRERASAWNRRMKNATWQSGAFRPFRVFGDEPARGMLPPGAPPFTELAARLRGSRAEVSPVSVGRSRHAVGRFPRLRGLPSSRWRGRILSDHNYPRRVSLSLKGRLSTHLAGPSLFARLSRRLSWAFLPYSTCGFEGPLAAGFACPLRSALGVWLPFRRFSPLKSSSALFRADSAPGISPSEPSPPTRYLGRFHPRSTHVPFHPTLFPAARRPAGPSERGSWAFALAGVL